MGPSQYISSYKNMDIHYEDEMVLPSSNLYNRNPIYGMAFFILRWAQGWGLISQFSPFRYFPIFFPNDQNNGYLYDIKFIFGRCHRSWAAETPGKYEHGWNYLTYTFAKSKFPVTEKLANGALVTPIPGHIRAWCVPIIILMLFQEISGWRGS